MALSANMDWYIRAGGDNTNGGGFDDTVAVPGTNYADQDAVKYSGVNLTVDAVTNTKVIPDGHTPDATDEGNVVRISTNTGGWTYGYYTITDQDGTAWTLDRSPAGVGVSGGAWRMGGAFATIWALHTGGSKTLPTVPSPLAAGHQVNIRGAGTDNPSIVDHDWDDGYGHFVNGTSAAGRVRWVGYNGRPLIGHWGLLFYDNTSWNSWSNLSFKQTDSTYTAFGVISTPLGAYIENCYFDQNGVDTIILHSLGYITTIRGCWFFNSGSKTANSKAAITDVGGLPLTVMDCVFEDLRGYAIDAIGSLVLIGNIFHACRATSKAIVERSQSALTYALSLIINNTFDDNDGGCVKFLDNYAAMGAIVLNNIFANTTNSAALDFNAADIPLNHRLVPTNPDYNCFYNNSDDRDYINAGANDLTSDPIFTNAAGGNWAVGTNMKAEGIPSLKFPASATTSYIDIGAVQRQEPILFGGASNILTLSKETGANARGGSGTCAKLDPGSTVSYGYWDFFVYVPAAEFKLSFYYKSYHTTSAWNGTLKVSMWDSDNYTEDPPALLNSVDVSGTYDATYRLWESSAKTAAAEGLCRVRIEIKDGADSGGVYIDDIAVTET